jgi:hypothetical protein
VFATDERFCIDNGAMIAHAGAEMLFTQYYCSQTNVIIGVRVVKSITPWIQRGPQVRNSKLNENKMKKSEKMK